MLSVSFLAFDMSDEMDDVSIDDKKCKCLRILGTIHIPIVSDDIGISSIFPLMHSQIRSIKVF